MKQHSKLGRPARGLRPAIAVAIAVIAIPLGASVGSAETPSVQMREPTDALTASSPPSGGSTWMRRAKGKTHLLQVARSGSSLRYLYVPYPWSYCAAGTVRGTRFVGRQHRRPGTDPILNVTRTFRKDGTRLRFNGHAWSRTTQTKAFRAAKKTNGPLTATIADLWARCQWASL